MNQTQVRSFVERYLTNMDCRVIESTPDHIEVQLSIKADQALLNRPFYWMYVEKMNLPAHPARFRFFFSDTKESKEFYSDYLYYGAPRFTQMLHSAQKEGRFCRLYQVPQSEDHFVPSKGYRSILAIYYRISYLCDQRKDRLRHLAIDLQTGEIDPSFYQWAKEQQWTQQLPPRRFLLPTHLQLNEAVGRCEQFLQKEIEQEDHSWAEEARKRLAEECHQIESYYAHETDKPIVEKKQRLREVIRQFSPRIEINVINTGFFYVDK